MAIEFAEEEWAVPVSSVASVKHKFEMGDVFRLTEWVKRALVSAEITKMILNGELYAVLDKDGSNLICRKP